MIQAVADEEERSKLGMHYTSVPNIPKVLNPLFLDELRYGGIYVVRDVIGVTFPSRKSLKL